MPATRDRLQSRLLVWLVGLVLAGCCLPCLVLMLHPYNAGRFALQAFGVSLTFGIVVWALRAATFTAALCGSMVCLLVTVGTMHGRGSLLYTGLTPLTLLFVLTFAATRIGKRRRPELTLPVEARRGRKASQVIANLGFAALLTIAGFFGGFSWAAHRFWGLQVTSALVVAALAEATADTLSSELGQAFGGTPYLLTSLRPTAPGTDGAVSILGTAAGILGATLVTASGAWALHLDLRRSLLAFAGAVAGLLFDSLLGATAERRGWLNNDLVNFFSTAFAAAFTLLALAV